MRHFYDLYTYVMKHSHMANGHPRRKIQKFPDGGASVPRRRGGRVPPVAPRLAKTTSINTNPCSAAPA